MSRPKQPSDPARHPIPCGRCHEHRVLVAAWPDGTVCANCYQKAKRTVGVCACSHEGVLPGIIEGQPACRACSKIEINVDCISCGTEGELYSGGRCWSCALGDAVDTALTSPETGTVTSELIRFAEALKGMKRANSGLTWIRQEHVQTFLRSLATSDSLSHDEIDKLPKSRTREFVRGLLVAHGIIDARDDYLARYQEWSDLAIKRVVDSTSREAIVRYIRWQHLRRMRQMDEVPVGSFLRSKQTVTVAINFVNWLDENGVALADVRQAHLDIWITTGPSTRQIADRFLRWAITNRIVRPKLKIAAPRRGTAARMSATEQEQAIETVVHGEVLDPRDRAAAMLVLVFGQQIRDVVTLKWDQVEVTEGMVTIRMATFVIELPEPLDAPWRSLRANPGHENTAAHPDSPWVFRGTKPGQHLHPDFFRNWMKRYFSTRAARLGTLHELSKLGPIPIIAEALGYSPETIERHARDSSANYARYVATVRNSDRPGTN